MRSELRRGLGLLTAARFVSNLAIRLVYPFLPAIARGLGVSFATVGTAASVRELAGLAGPAIGHRTTPATQPRILVLGMVAVGVFSLASAAGGGIVAFTIALTLVAAAQVAVGTASAAWLSDRVDYAERGRVLGTLELSWAGALLIGVPLLAVLIDPFGWNAPFVAVGAASLVMAAVLWARLPRNQVPVVPAPEDHEGGSDRAALGLYAVIGLIAVSIQIVTVVYGAWLEDDFGLSVTGVGVASIAAGLAELLGSGASAGLTDRTGKRRSIAIGALLMIPAACLLGTVGGNTAYGLMLLAVMFAGFEFAFVSAQPLIAELVPHARGRALGTAFAVATVARALGNLVGTWTYTEIGIGVTGLAAALAAVLAVALTVAAVREPRAG